MSEIRVGQLYETISELGAANRGLNERVATLEAALDKAKQRELTILGWLQERDAWAKAWKWAAKLARHGWLAHILPGLPRAWHKRRRGFLKLLWWTR